MELISLTEARAGVLAGEVTEAVAAAPAPLLSPHTIAGVEHARKIASLRGSG